MKLKTATLIRGMVTVGAAVRIFIKQEWFKCIDDCKKGMCWFTLEFTKSVLIASITKRTSRLAV